MQAKYSVTLILLSTVVVSGCTNLTNTPAYQRPATSVPTSFSENGKVGSNNLKMLAWQQFFTDPAVKTLITKALKHNTDLHIAAANEKKLRSAYQIQLHALNPLSNTSISLAEPYNWSKATGDSVLSHSHSATVGMTSYEINFWGRVGSLKDSALADYFASIESYRTTKISVISETANAYYNWLAAKENIDLSKKTINSRNQSLRIISLKREAGISSELDKAQAEVSKASVEVQEAQSEKTLAKYYASLQLLVGHSVKDSLNKGRSINQQHFKLAVPENLNSTVLLNRPDVIVAEENLRAANANIGAARAAFLPTISLEGNVGLSNDNLSDILKSRSLGAAITPSLYLPLFKGNLKANLAISNAEKQSLVAQYQKTLQTAFSEVYTQLKARKAVEKEIRATRKLVGAQQKRLKLSQARYDAGLSSYLDVLSAQEDLFSAQQSVLSAKGAEISATIQLYKALGGGDDISRSARDVYQQKAKQSKPTTLKKKSKLKSWTGKMRNKIYKLFLPKKS